MNKTDNKTEKFADKYPPSIQKKGFSQVPNCLLLCHHSLGLTTPEAMTLLVLHAHDFGSKEVYLAHSTLGKYVGRGKSTAQANIKSLADKGFIEIKSKTGHRNAYKLLPLIPKLANHECLNPINKSVDPYQKTGRPPYQKTRTKEEVPRRSVNKIGEIIAKRGHTNHSQNKDT